MISVHIAYAQRPQISGHADASSRATGQAWYRKIRVVEQGIDINGQEKLPNMTDKSLTEA